MMMAQHPVKKFSSALSTGTPSAFDHSPSAKLVAIASDNNITLLNYSCTDQQKYCVPRQVLFYEQPHIIAQLKFQKLLEQPLLAMVCGGLASLWDPTRPRSPLVQFVPLAGDAADMQWSIYNPYLLCTANNHGTLATWDLRADPSSSRPANQVALGKLCNNIQFCPTSEYLISSLCGERVVIWDIRKPPTYSSYKAPNTNRNSTSSSSSSKTASSTSSSSASSINIIDDSTLYAIIESVNHPIDQYVWHTSGLVILNYH
jgi:WD40 repeat protein